MTRVGWAAVTAMECMRTVKGNARPTKGGRGKGHARSLFLPRSFPSYLLLIHVSFMPLCFFAIWPCCLSVHPMIAFCLPLDVSLLSLHSFPTLGVVFSPLLRPPFILFHSLPIVFVSNLLFLSILFAFSIASMLPLLFLFPFTFPSIHASPSLVVVVVAESEKDTHVARPIRFRCTSVLFPPQTTNHEANHEEPAPPPSFPTIAMPTATQHENHDDTNDVEPSSKPPRSTSTISHESNHVESIDHKVHPPHCTKATT